MRHSNSTLIVGAGASAEIGLPISVGLTQQISKKLEMRFQDFDQTSGDEIIKESIVDICEKSNTGMRSPDEYFDTCREICLALPQASSIDAYIDARKDNEKIALCAKLAISITILEAERSSFMYTAADNPDQRLNYEKLQDTWYVKLMKLLSQQCDRENLDKFFKNISIISFNYDRCVEHYFYNAIQDYYAISEAEASKCLSQLRIYHPYGAVGKLPWQNSEISVPFGARPSAEILTAVAGQINTFTEHLHDEMNTENMQNEIVRSDSIIFLGFGFHPPNMQLLNVLRMRGLKRIIASTYGIKDGDLNTLEEVVRKSFPYKKMIYPIFLKPGLKCGDVFEEYRLTLSNL